MFTPRGQTQSPVMICPDAPRKIRVVSNAKNLVSRNLANSFNRYLNVPCAPTKVGVPVTRDYIKPVILFH